MVRRTKNKLEPGDIPKPERSLAKGGQDAVPEGPDESVEEQPKSREIGGPEGPEPTRYGDWERKGRCIDF